MLLADAEVERWFAECIEKCRLSSGLSPRGPTPVTICMVFMESAKRRFPFVGTLRTPRGLEGMREVVVSAANGTFKPRGKIWIWTN